MKKIYSLRKSIFKFLPVLVLISAGIMIFTAQSFMGFDDSSPYYDRPTAEYYSHFMPPRQEGQKDVITDLNGYDNFDIGIDYSEMNATVNPNNPLQIFFGVNSNSGLNARWTLDGYTWSSSSLSYPGGTCCDPWTAYDSLGNLFYSVLVSANYVAKSTNFGQTFGSFTYAVAGGDRNSLAADYTAGPYTNNLYATAWSPNTNFARSTDHGVTWQTTLSGSPNTTPGNMICVGPNGSTQGGCVYWVTITGSNPAPSTFNFFRSTDGGASLQQMSAGAISPGYVGTLNSASRLVINNARTRPYPMIACDNSYGPYRGRLYCVYASNNPPGNGNRPDIKCQYSTDGGATWSAGVTVNDDANSQNNDQWYPAVWSEKTTGKLYVKWYDDRNGSSTYQMDVYASYSTDGGQTFVTNQRLTNASWTYPCPACGANQNCYRGDYDAIAANPLCAFAVWYDARNCTYQNMGSYFPDFAVKTSASTLNITNQNDSVFAFVSIPSVKLYTDKAKFLASVTPTPSSGTLTLSFVKSSSNIQQDSLTAYPDSLRLRVKATGGVTSGAYTITVTTQGSNGTPVHKRTINLNVSPVGLSQNDEQIPKEFALLQNYPNPFNPSTNIRFDVPVKGTVKLSVFDVTGKLVTTLVHATFDPGKYSISFDGGNLSSGIYFYKLETLQFTDVRKMILVK